MRRYRAGNRLNRLGTLTYAGRGCHDPKQVRTDAEQFFRNLRDHLGGTALPYLWVPEVHPGGHGLHLHFAVARFIKRSVIADAYGDSEEAVSIPNPVPGTYTVQIDGFDVPAGTTLFDYRDVFFSPALGEVEVPGTVTELPRGGNLRVAGTVTAEASPAAGRQLLGKMSVVSSEGAVLGTGSVQITAVVP